MALLDLFRSQPEWKHADPDVRAAAVRRLPSSEHELLTSIVRDDDDARVRRAAARRLSDAPTLVEISRRDADESVRREAAETLLDLALRAGDPAAGLQALEGVSEPRALASVVRDAQHPDVRRAALGRIDDARTLAALARSGNDVALQVLAVERLHDPALLADLALRSEQRAVALAAVERVNDVDALRFIAEKAKHRGAARRAGTRLADVLPPSAASATTTAEAVDAAEHERWELAQAAERERRAELERQAVARMRGLGAREALVERIEALGSGDLVAGMSHVRAEWDALEPLDDPEAEDLYRRFLRACLDCEERARALAHAETLRPQVEALAARAEQAAAHEDVAAARAEAAAVEKAWAELRGATGAFPDLRARYETAEAHLHERDEQARAERARRVAEARARFEQLCAAIEAQAAAAHPNLKEADRLLREARHAIDDPGPLGAKPERDTLLARLKAARAALYPRVQELRQDAEWKRWASAELRDDLVRRAEALAESQDADKIDRELRDLEQEWRRALTGARDVPAELIERWNAAHDPLRARCDAALRARHAEWAGNLLKKEALCARAEALAESTDWLKTAEELQRLQAEWKVIGPVSPRHTKGVWERFRKPCDRFFTRRKADLDQRKHGWHRNLERKQALIARAEELSRSTDWDAAAAEVKKLQAEWKTVGPVRKSQSDAVWQRFRGACDAFFTRFKQRDQIAVLAVIEEREALLAEASSWLPEGGAAEPPHDLAERLHALGARWRETRAVGEQAQAQDERYLGLRHSLVAAYPERFRGTDLDPEANRKRREKLVERAESLVEQLEPAHASADRSVESVADQLKQALAANALGGKRAVEERQRALLDELSQLRDAWRRLTPLPGHEGASLQQRFDAACSRTARRANPKTT
jgi:hypothetical protein